MKKNEKPTTTLYQKINTISDWVIRLVMINVLIVITSLPLITLFPSLSAGYKLFHQYVNQEEVKLFKNYFVYFKENFKKKLLLGLSLTIIIILGYVNSTYYVDFLNESVTWFYAVGYYVTLTVLVIALLVNLYALTVITFAPHARIGLIYKFSLYLSGKFFIQTILLFLTLSIPLVLLMIPTLHIVLVFAGFSIPVLLNVLISQKVVTYIKELMETND